WMATREVALNEPQPTEQDTPTSQEERHVTHRRIRLSRVPATWLEYAYGGHQFEVVAVGNGRRERFWADECPPRWSHVGRFFKALVRDLNGEHTQRPPRSNGTLHVLDEYRTNKADLPHVRILEDGTEEQPAKAGEDTEAPAEPEASAEPEAKE